MAVAVAICVAIGLIMHSPFQGAPLLLLIIAVPRLHDIGKSGWWALGVLAVEFLAGMAIGKFLPPEQLLSAITATALVVVALAILLGCLPGQGEPNRYGPVPASGLSYTEPAKPSA